MGLEFYRSFMFRYVHDPKSPGKVRIYLEIEPSYGSRSKDTHTAHRWPANNDGFKHPPYICIKEAFKPSSYETAKKLAHDWADRTIRYIETGISISDQIKRG
jgi:hypothetical protein